MMFPTPLEILMSWTLPLLRRLLAPVLDRLDELEFLIMARTDDLLVRLNTATNELASDLQELKAALADATAGSDTKVAQAVNAVLDRFDAPIATLEAMGAVATEPVAPQGPPPSDGGDGIPAGPIMTDPEPDLDPEDDTER